MRWDRIVVFIPSNHQRHGLLNQNIFQLQLNDFFWFIHLHFIRGCPGFQQTAQVLKIQYVFILDMLFDYSRHQCFWILSGLKPQTSRRWSCDRKYSNGHGRTLSDGCMGFVSACLDIQIIETLQQFHIGSKGTCFNSSFIQILELVDNLPTRKNVWRDLP